MTNIEKTYKLNLGGRERRPPHKLLTAQGKNKMKQKNFTNKTLSDYNIGQIDALNRLYTIIDRWIKYTKNYTLEEFLEKYTYDPHAAIIIKERITTYEKILNDILNIKESLEEK